MASLVARILGWENEHAIGEHTWCAAMGELERGETTKAEIVSYFGLDAVQEDHLDQLIAHVMSMPAVERFKFRTELQDVLYLARSEIKYDTVEKVHARLGIT